MFKIYEQLLPKKLYSSKNLTHTSCLGDVKCRLCGHAQESVPHILAGCTALAQDKYFFRHNMALKVLFDEILRDQDLLEEIPPWYAPVMPKPVYKSEKVGELGGMYLCRQIIRRCEPAGSMRGLNHASKKS